MKLGILVNTDKHLPEIIGITKAAQGKGHEVIIFTMDDGSRLLDKESFTALHLLDKVRISFCEHSCKGLSLTTDHLPPAIAAGSQYNNAAMVNQADKVLVL
jgi:hypothetical protein